MDNKFVSLSFLLFLGLQYVPLTNADNYCSSDDRLVVVVVDDDFEVLDSRHANYGNKLVSVDDFGAKGDRIYDDTKAFLDAWKRACSTSNSTIMVPQNNHYLVSAARFKEPCAGKLTVQIDGTIVAPGDPKKWYPRTLESGSGFTTLPRPPFGQGSGIIDRAMSRDS